MSYPFEEVLRVLALETPSSSLPFVRGLPVASSASYLLQCQMIAVGLVPSRLNTYGSFFARFCFVFFFVPRDQKS